MEANSRQDSFILDRKQRTVVDESIRKSCDVRGFRLLALNVRSNHVHVVVAAQEKPEKILTRFKRFSTRALRGKGLVGNNRKIWSRGGSRRYLWKRRYVDLAIDYVVYGQGKLEFEDPW